MEVATQEEEIKKLSPVEKKSLDKSLFSWKNTALTEDDLEKFCKKNHIQFALKDLQELPAKGESISNNFLSKGAFIYTGAKEDDRNNGSPKHFLYLWLDNIFDSYGSHDYNVSEDFGYFKNHSRQYQEYNSMVCGEYCLAFAKFIQENPDTPANDGHDFADEFGLTSNRKHNDEIIKTWYEDHK